MSRVLVFRTSGERKDSISALDFSVMSPEDIERMSVLKVDQSSLYTKGDMKPGGLLDTALGTLDRRVRCRTCNQDCRQCPGHVGSLQLPVPVYHMSYMDAIIKVLRMVCFFCNRLCAPVVHVNDTVRANHQVSKHRFASQLAACKSQKTCCHCSAPLPEYSRNENQTTIGLCWKKAEFASAEEAAFATADFNVFTVYSILNGIPDEDARSIGFDVKLCHPRNFIIWSLLVPSLAIRPSVMLSEGSRKRGQDDLTSRLQEIVKARNDLLAIWNNMAPPEHATVRTEVPCNGLRNEQLWSAWSKMQVDIAMYMNTGFRLKKITNGRGANKSVMDKLKGKDGRIRGNLMGKRVDHCARTVITPDPNIDIDEVGVPRQIALKLTIGERVNMINIKDLTERVRVGDAIGGAATIITDEGSVYELKYCKNRENIVLRYGWVVERYLRDGDYVMFNRQPSLHRNSIMGHKVRLMYSHTFRLNLSCSNPYNADFDGDEMNLHVPQNPTVRSEVRHVMSVARQLISPKANKPVMGVVQDSMLGAHLMSLLDTFVNRRQFTRIAMSVSSLVTSLAHPVQIPPPAIAWPRPMWTGKQVLQMVLPHITMGMPGEDGVCSLDATTVVLCRGEFVSGVLTKDNLGAVSNGIVQRAVGQVGSEETARFLGDIQRVTNQFLLDYGFSVGIGDCVVPAQCEADMRCNLQSTMAHVDAIYQETLPKYSAPCETPLDLIEATVSNIASKVMMQVGGNIKSIMTHTNALVAMITSGSKGNVINLAQIMGCVGQNCVNGARILPPSGSNRVLSCYVNGDHSLSGSGFVSNSYVLGLHPDEYFFHAMGGREGLVDTAVKTAVTGYLQRRMIKSGESKSVAIDGSVREPNGSVVEFVYGGDCMNPVRLEKVAVPQYLEGDASLRRACWMHPDLPCQSAAQNGEIFEAEWRDVLAARTEVRRARLIGGNREAATTFFLPCNVELVARHVVTQAGHRPRLTTLQPGCVRAKVNELIDAVHLRLPAEVTAGFVFTIRYHLRSAHVIGSWAMSVLELDSALAHIWERFCLAICPPGEMVGCIAAQSIGEKCTQMTLNTFHLAGVLQSVTMGIPRFKELINVTKNTKTPTMCIRPLPQYSRGEKQLKSASRQLVCTLLKDVITSIDVVARSDLEARGEVWHTGACFLGEDALRADCWVRFELDMYECIARGIQPWKVGVSIEQVRVSGMECVWSDTNTDQWQVYACCTDMDGVMAALGVSRGPTSHTDPDGVDATVQTKADLINVATHLSAVHVVCGEVSVKSASEQAINVSTVCAATHRVETCASYVIDTIGSDLHAIKKHAWIDWYNTTSNDIIEVYTVLGLEAAVRVLFDEMTRIISHDGGYIDHRHLMIIVNTMTHKGYVMPLSRHGINRTDNSVLVRSSFEETGDVVRDAAMFGERDEVAGVSQSIMLGTRANVGSGHFDVLVPDTHSQQRGEPGPARVQGIVKTTIRKRDRGPSSGPLPSEVRLVSNIADSRDTSNVVERPFVHDAAAPPHRGEGGLWNVDCDPPFVTDPSAGAAAASGCSMDHAVAPEGFCDSRHSYPHQDHAKSASVGFKPSTPKMCKWK